MELLAAAALAEGLHVYVGAPGTGKTTAMLQDVVTLHQRTGKAGLVVYSGEDPREHPEASVSRLLRVLDERATLEGALFSAFAARSLVLYRPRTADDVLGVIRTARSPGRILLGIDDVGVWTHSAKLRQELGDLAATWRHARTSVFLTLQHVGSDLSQRIRSCAPVVRVFRVPASTTLEWAVDAHGLDPERLAALPRGAFELCQY